jgi:hypothetical protein
MPAVPDETERACGAPVSSQNFSSKALQRGPVVIQPDLRHATTSWISFSPIEGLLKGKKSFLLSKVKSLFSPEHSPLHGIDCRGSISHPTLPFLVRPDK